MASRTMPAWKLGLAKFLASPWFFVLGPTRVFGKKNVPRRGGLLIVANHVSSLDPGLVQWACPRHVFFMAEKELFDMPVAKQFATAWQAFPVQQNAPDRGALRRAQELLADGQVVCIFPEGGLSRTEELDELKGGAALIIRQWQGPVIALGITGSRRAMPYGAVVPRPALHWITLRWGEAKTPPSSKEGGVQSLLVWLRSELLAVLTQKAPAP